MKKTTHYKGHRWTNEELTKLMRMWQDDCPVQEIADALSVTQFTVFKQTVKLRANGVPLKRRRAGNIAGRHNQLWTQEEVEYLVRRRNEKDTLENIGNDLGRTHSAVSGMIKKLLDEGVAVPMRGQGVRKLWDANKLRSAVVGRGLLERETATIEEVA